MLNLISACMCVGAAGIQKQSHKTGHSIKSLSAQVVHFLEMNSVSKNLDISKQFPSFTELVHLAPSCCGGKGMRGFGECFS